MTEVQIKSTIDELLDFVNQHSIEDSLRKFVSLYPGQVAFSSSLGWEDQVITHYIFSNDLPIRVFTLDTGRMFNETYKVLSATIRRYDKNIQVYYPQTKAVEDLVTQKGPFSFYDSVENRKECCFIRKVEPLNRALKDMKIWVTGIRADQSNNRMDMKPIEWDEQHQLFKFHPLFHWSLQEVKDFIAQHNIPYNALHDKGFPSIGCAPCTRAVNEGEDIRSGRWWWEDNSKKECGLHTHN